MIFVIKFRYCDSSFTPKSSIPRTWFDIKDFYPSISETLLKEALNFAMTQTKITKKDIDIIMYAKKSLLFNEDHVWIKPFILPPTHILPYMIIDTGLASMIIDDY